MKKFIKNLFCRHSDVTIKTSVFAGSPFIVTSVIQCETCKKTFAKHPNARWGYVEHIHSQTIWEYMVKDISQFK